MGSVRQSVSQAGNSPGVRCCYFHVLRGGYHLVRQQRQPSQAAVAPRLCKAAPARRAHEICVGPFRRAATVLRPDLSSWCRLHSLV